jgi:hypothetical protein
MKIILTENQIAKILKEDRVDFLRAKFVDGEQQLIDSETFGKFIEADPTKNKQFVQWLCQIYLNKKLRLEDLYKATEYLTLYSSPKIVNKLTSDQKNIYAVANGQLKIPDLQTLFQIIEPFKEVKSQKEVSAEIKKDAPVVFKSADWIVVMPKTKEASCAYGANTRLCTTARHNNGFDDYYSEKTPIYLNINRKTGKKFQFYVGTVKENQFRDDDDKDINLPHFFENNKDLAEFYHKIWFSDLQKICFFYNIENYTKNQDGSINVDGNVNINDMALTKIPIKFNIVNGSFNCSGNELTTLENSPREIKFDFNCFANNLKSLNYGPIKVGSNYNCSKNLLSNLKGCVENVPNNFACNNNVIETFEGDLKFVGANFWAIDQKNKKEFREKDVKRFCKVKGDIYV